jgi:hypothetical protein
VVAALDFIDAECRGVDAAEACGAWLQKLRTILPA